MGDSPGVQTRQVLDHSLRSTGRGQYWHGLLESGCHDPVVSALHVTDELGKPKVKPTQKLLEDPSLSRPWVWRSCGILWTCSTFEELGSKTTPLFARWMPQPGPPSSRRPQPRPWAQLFFRADQAGRRACRRTSRCCRWLRQAGTARAHVARARAGSQRVGGRPCPAARRRTTLARGGCTRSAVLLSRASCVLSSLLDGLYVDDILMARYLVPQELS